MVAKEYRFHGHGSLRFSLRRGESEHTPYFKLKHTANPRRSSWRLAIVVSKKVHKSAVVRNRIRRRLYELIRTQLPTLKANPDLIIIVKDSRLADCPWSELVETCQPLLKKLEKMYNPTP